MKKEDSRTISLEIWRQSGPDARGDFEKHQIEVTNDVSLFDTLDMVNERLINQGRLPIAFDSDCREGICGTCGLVINGQVHGPIQTTTCQLHMHHFKNTNKLTIEPFRSRAMPIEQDLIVDKSALEEVAKAGAYVSMHTGSQPEASNVVVSKERADEAFDYAACIGCGACVASCRNGAAHLFAGAKIAQFLALPQGQHERGNRALNLVMACDKAGFGSCSNDGECEAICPKLLKTGAIAAFQREVMRAFLRKALGKSIN